MKTTKLFLSFFESEKSSAVILLTVTVLSLIITNSAWQVGYTNLFSTIIAGYSIHDIINDGLMTVFFLMIGLELEREVYIGELSSIKKALLPFMAAIGGMLMPSLLYWFINKDTPYKNGMGIPMATDIAFAIGILSLLGKKIPASLKIFLTALAVIDDLGAIIIIALFYSKKLHWGYLGMAMLFFGILLLFNRLKIYRLLPYLIIGFIMWYCMLHSGVHATITGVLLAFAIPFQNGEEKSISYKLQYQLHKPVSFIILPLFALVNTAIKINTNSLDGIFETYSMGIIIGLVVGKPLGIILISYLCLLFKMVKFPKDLLWKHIIGASMLAGIGFTMSIFMTLLAFNNSLIVNNAKLSIIVASLTSGILGFLFLKIQLVKRKAA